METAITSPAETSTTPVRVDGVNNNRFVKGPGYQGNIHENLVIYEDGYTFVREYRHLAVDLHLYHAIKLQRKRAEGQAENEHIIEGEGYRGTVQEWYTMQYGDKMHVSEMREIEFEPALHRQLIEAERWVPDGYDEYAKPYGW